MMDKNKIRRPGPEVDLFLFTPVWPGKCHDVYNVRRPVPGPGEEVFPLSRLNMDGDDEPVHIHPSEFSALVLIQITNIFYRERSEGTVSSRQK
jgi:hypothetical protein